MPSCTNLSLLTLIVLSASSVVFYLRAFIEWKSQIYTSFDIATANMESNNGYRAVAYFVNWSVTCQSKTPDYETES